MQPAPLESIWERALWGWDMRAAVQMLRQCSGARAGAFVSWIAPTTWLRTTTVFPPAIVVVRRVGVMQGHAGAIQNA
mgnify:CR=1 FL=1